MPRSFLSVHHLTFKYSSAVDPVIDDFSCQFETGWTGIVGANGCGKTTLLKLIAGELEPDSGQLCLPSRVIYCEQRTDHLPASFHELMEDYSKEAFRIRDDLGIREEWGERWNTLSHGERKRIQLASALFQQPDILAVDEPTNHLDQPTRRMLLNALRTYRGIGLLVSHDREFLDTLSTHTLFMRHGEVLYRKGNYSAIHADLLQEEAFKAQQVINVKKKMKKLQVEIAQRKHKAAQADHKKSKKHLSRKDHDAKLKMDLARLSGKDAVEGQIKKRLDTQLNRLKESGKSIGWKKPPPSGIRIESGNPSSQSFLFHLSPFKIPLGERILCAPYLFLKRGERIGLIGPNGAGKSILFHYLIEHIGIQKEEILMIPQEVDEYATRQLVEEIRTESKERLAMLMALISRLGSQPEGILESPILSPGEMRKLMLARGILNQPKLILMDEPTNHMDLPSIQFVENALDGCNCAMILISHDMRFLSNLNVDFWRIETAESGVNRLNLSLTKPS